MAAGLGFKTFTTGEVLTAADTNGYLMQGVLVFASSAARASAITAPQEGQYSYLKDTNSTEYYDGAAWVAAATGDVTGVTAGNGISVTSPTGPVPTIAIDTAVTVDKTTAQTLTNKTLTSPALTTPTISTLTTNGDLLYGTGSGALSRLGIGSTSQVLTVTGGVPVWATPAGGSSFVGCAVYKVTTAQTLSNDTDTDITFNAEDFDTNSYHDNTTNNERITIPSGKAGKYLLQTAILFASNSSGVRNVAFKKNGTTVMGSMLNPALSSFAQRVQHIYIADLAVGDYITVNVNQNSGGNLNALADQVYTRFTATYLGA